MSPELPAVYHQVSTTINGQLHRLQLEARASLPDALRKKLPCSRPPASGCGVCRYGLTTCRDGARRVMTAWGTFVRPPPRKVMRFIDRSWIIRIYALHPARAQNSAI